MSWLTPFYLLIALLLVLLNGFFVLAEFALVKVRSSRIEELVRQGSRRAMVVREMVAHLDEYLSATQLGITVASLGLGWLGEPAFAGLIEAIITPAWLVIDSSECQHFHRNFIPHHHLPAHHRRGIGPQKHGHPSLGTMRSGDCISDAMGVRPVLPADARSKRRVQPFAQAVPAAGRTSRIGPHRAGVTHYCSSPRKRVATFR